VVADGRVFVYADWVKKYVVTSKMLADWGWMDGVPDELAVKIEKARNDRATKFSGAALEKYIDDFLATLDPDQAKKFGEHIRKRIRMGFDWNKCEGGTAVWWSMAAIIEGGFADKVFPTFAEFNKSCFKEPALRGHPLITGDAGGSFIIDTVEKTAERADTVFCLDAATGKELWKKEFPGEGNTTFGNYNWGGASPTPAIANGKCYAAGSAGVYCLSAKDGSVIWQVKTGFTHSSPLVANGKVYAIVTPPVRTSNVWTDGQLTAFDAETGKLLWRQASVKNTFNSVALWSHEGKSYVLAVAAGEALLCIDADTGAVAWKSAETFIAKSTATPVVVGDVAVVRGSAAFRLTPQKAELLWKGQLGGCYYGGDPVVFQDFVYLASAYGEDRCLDLKTGAKKWDAKVEIFSEAPAAADGKIFLIYGKREIGMIKASPEGFVELGHFAAVSPVSMFSSPAVAGGKLFVRLCDCVACYDLAAP
jgi:outer membrane protein assembly factor BamB